ncbi:MAG: iron-sulfur cluster assembly scaffold protein [Chitinophagaceae bacterium]|nr:iron-sulfur cluster assembly scaffold protein [Anaerolineae bacterium]
MDEFMHREYILDHAENQRNHGLLDPADIHREVANPLCGDRLTLTLQVNNNGCISAVGWEGEGCAISQAAASMLGEAILGISVDEAFQVTREDVLNMIGISLTLNRVKCALLSLKALHEGIEIYRQTIPKG